MLIMRNMLTKCLLLFNGLMHMIVISKHMDHEVLLNWTEYIFQTRVHALILTVQSDSICVTLIIYSMIYVTRFVCLVLKLLVHAKNTVSRRQGKIHAC